MNQSFFQFFSLIKATVFIVLFLSSKAGANDGLVICGGPALKKWDDLRPTHERCLLPPRCFVNAAAYDAGKLSSQKDANVTFLVYRDSFLRRSLDEKVTYTQEIEVFIAKHKNLKLVWFRSGQELSNYLSSITPVDFVYYYGYATPNVLVFDYESEISRGSTAWLSIDAFFQAAKGALKEKGVCQLFPAFTGWNADFTGVAQKAKKELGRKLVVPTVQLSYSTDSEAKEPYTLESGS